MGLTSEIAMDDERADQQMKGTCKMTFLTTPSRKAMTISTHSAVKRLDRLSGGPEITSTCGQFALKNWQKI